MKLTKSEIVELLTIVKSAIIDDPRTPIDTTLKNVRPDSLSWVIDTTINYIKESD